MHWGCGQQQDYTDKSNNDTYEYKVSRRNIMKTY